jgi:hypothetical protein
VWKFTAYAGGSCGIFIFPRFDLDRMKPSNEIYRTICGGCGDHFASTTAKQAAKLLQEHIHDAPCPHYANPTELELRLRQWHTPATSGDHEQGWAVTTNTGRHAIEGARTHAEFRLRAWNEMRSPGGRGTERHERRY